MARRRGGLRAIAPALLAALAIAGCGTDAIATPTTPPLSRAQFVAGADAICKRSGQRQNLAAQNRFRGREPTAAQIAGFTQEVAIPGMEAQVRALRSLNFSSPTVTKILDLAETDLHRVQADPALLAGARNPFADFARLAHSYGLTACAPAG